MLNKRNYYNSTVLCTCAHKVVILVSSVKMGNDTLYGVYVYLFMVCSCLCFSGYTKQASGRKHMHMRVVNGIWCASVNTS